MSRTATKTQDAVIDVVLNDTAVANIEKAQDLAAIHEQEKSELMDLGRRLGQMETAAFRVANTTSV